MNFKDISHLELVNFITQYYYADAKAEMLSRFARLEKLEAFWEYASRDEKLDFEKFEWEVKV